MKVSIISGIYNVSKFLKQWELKDIIDQSFKDWELLLVDDGSTDDSGFICDEYAKKDSRIKVIHKENGGLGSARNAGLDAAEGEYVWFYDVDDHAELNLLEYCVNEMDAKNLDLMMFGFRAITPDLNLEEDVHLNESLLDGQQQLCEHYLDDILFVKHGNGFAWNKLYRRSFLEKHHLRYENQRIQQDEVFNLKVYPHLERVYLSPKVLYHYYIYGSGNTRSRFIPNRFDIYVSIREHFEELKRQWNISDPRFDDYLNDRFYQSVNQTLRFNMFHPNCPWTKEEKKDEMNRVMEHPYTLDSIKWKQCAGINIEEKIYLKTYKGRDITELSIIAKFFNILHTIRRKLK